jgi:hypothetical protein
MSLDFEKGLHYVQRYMLKSKCRENERSEPTRQILVFSILILCTCECLIAQKKGAETGDTSKNVVQEVKDYSKKDNFFSRIVKSILINEVPQPGNATLKSDKIAIKRFTGKVIRNIDVEILDVFGASVDSPMDTVRSWLQEKGNSLHLKTKDWLIKNKLIFSEGQTFIPFYIQESERIIRQSPYVYDVRIIPQKIRNNADSVDIMVYVQDIWSITGGASYSPGSKEGSTSFEDLNFLGFGNDFRTGFKFDHELAHGWDWDGSYTINNIASTFLSASIFYSSERDRQLYGVKIGRDFISPVIKWGGGIAQQWQNTRYPDETNTSGFAETARYNQQDYWLGYAFDLGAFDPTTVYQNRFNVAGRVTRTVYSERPAFDTTNLFQDNTFYLGRIGFSDRTYYQDQYVFGLGRTEDIPLINMIEFLFGLEEGANSSRPYFGLKTGYSFYNDHLGYLYGGFQTGVFRSNEKWSSRTSILEMLYFSDLYAIGEYEWRHYIGSRYSYSDDPVVPQGILNINDQGGLRGFSDSYLTGNKKLVLNYEADIFVPLQFFGFKLALITFADFGLISPSNSSLLDSKLYQGYGLGFRIKNEHLIFPPFQFMFAFYPNTPEAGGQHFNMFHQSSIFYQFNQFQFSTPSVVSAQ